MRVLVLGSEGTLGSSICSYLEARAIEVVHWDIKLGLQFDLRAPNNIDDVLQTVDYVFFLAFDVGGSKYDVNNKPYIDNNMQLILNTFASLEKANVPFTYTTSQMSNMHTNPYGVLKRISDFYVEYLKGVNVRIWNVYGLESIDSRTHVIPDFVHKAWTTGKITMLSDGTDQRQFMHCNDFADAMYHIMMNHEAYTSHGKVIDFASFAWVSIMEVAEVIQYVLAKQYNHHVTIETKPYKNNNHMVMNEPVATLFHSQWQPKLSLEEGIADVIKKYISSSGI